MAARDNDETAGKQMAPRFVLSDYVEQAMLLAVYDKLKDGTFAGRIPPCEGVVAFGATLRQSEDELRSTLEDWILCGLKLRHPLPVIAGINLNREPAHEPVGAL
jgi:predicted RNase H-like HicB family nuclease